MQKSLTERFLAPLEHHFWFRHGLFWLVNTLFFLLSICRQNRFDAFSHALLTAALFLLLFLGATYPLLYGVLPLYWKNRPGWFGMSLLGWAIGSLLLHYGFRQYILHPFREGLPVPTNNPDFRNPLSAGTTVIMFATAGTAAGFKLLRHWYRQEKANQQLIQENIHAELKLLRAQIHPHFLFNTLNNLYALTLKQSDRAPEMVSRLSGLLTYITEECNQGQVPLSREVQVLHQYIQLEALRYGDRLQVTFQAEGVQKDHQIGPLLLLPFVENAFKHGSAEQLGKAFLRLRLRVEGGVMHFQLLNSRNASDAPAVSPQPGGIGLKNVKKRLELLYPGQYQLTLESGEATFSVRFSLRLPGGERASTKKPAHLDQVFLNTPFPSPVMPLA